MPRAITCLWILANFFASGIKGRVQGKSSVAVILETMSLCSKTTGERRAMFSVTPSGLGDTHDCNVWIV
jgi:hypothetical protein